jgi:hypothetical protein
VTGTPHEWAVRDLLIGPSAGPADRPAPLATIVGPTITLDMDRRAALLDAWTVRSTPAT